MTDAMDNVLAARRTNLEAHDQVKRTRLALGEAIHKARPPRGQEHNPPPGTYSQRDIAAALEVTREQVRRWEAEYTESRAEQTKQAESATATS